MKHREFYNKCKANYPPIENPIFSMENWWGIVLIAIAAILIEPLLFMSKYQRAVPLSFNYYLQLIEYFLFIAVPFVALLLFVNWRESIKRRRGYSWMGKFEVINKQTTIAFFYFQLTPGNSNKLRVNRSLFDKTRIGDFIMIRRDALGRIEGINRINNSSSRLTRTRHFPKSSSSLYPKGVTDI